MKLHMPCLSALIIFTACGNSDPEDKGGNPPPAIDYRPVPGSGVDGSCHTVYEPPTIAAWAEAVDALVIAQVIAVDPLTSPASVAQTGANPAYIEGEECTGALEPGIVVTLGERHVERISEGLPRIREVVLGKQIMRSWAARPTIHNGELQWSPTNRGGIYTGQVLGLALRYDEAHGKWTTAGLPIFQLNQQGRLVYAEDEPCLRPPADHRDVDLDGYQRALDERGDNFEADVADARDHLPWPDEDSRLASWLSATCIVRSSDQVPDGTCRSQVDCSAPDICVDGRCVHDPNVVQE